MKSSHVIFGYDLDGLISPDSLPEPIQGKRILGAHGFLEHLELCFGCGVPPVADVIRIAQFLARLGEIDDGNRFYSKSLQSDSWSTSAYLLSKRDQLIGAGWRPQRGDFGSIKLETFTALEQSSLPLSMGYSDRIQLLLKLIEDSRLLPDIKSITLLTPADLLPIEWRRILISLSNRGVQIISAEIVRPNGTGMLKSLQQFCFDGSFIYPGNDDSNLILLESDDELRAAEFLAAWLSNRTNAGLTIIRGEGAFLLDEFCSLHNLPRIGGETHSKFRGLLALLPLFIETIWFPVDIERVLELLSLPFSPLPSVVCFWLKEAIREQPGIGGTAWNVAWDIIAEKLNQEYSETGTVEDGSTNKLLGDELSEYKSWFELGSFDNQKGAPVDLIISVCKKVSDWAAGQVDFRFQLLSKSVASHAEAVASALKIIGMPLIQKVQLDRIIDSAFDSGVSLSTHHAEASAWSLVDKPGQVWAPIDSLLWWGFTGGEERGAQQFWSSAELSTLDSYGIAPDTVGLSKLRDAHNCQQAIMSVCRSALIVKPISSMGRQAHPHPFWPQTKAWLKHLPTELRRKVFVNTSEEAVHGYTILGTNIPTSLVQPLHLPLAKRVWRIPGAMVKHPEKTSFTNMALLLSCPFAWTADQICKVKIAQSLDVPGEERLVGNLAHKIIAVLLGERRWAPDEAANRALALFDELLPKEALPLMKASMSLQVRRFRESLRKSVSLLVSLLNEAELKVIACELSGAKSFLDSQFVGSVDLVCRNREGQIQIIDLKWTKNSKYRRAEMQEGKALQLAAYSWLLGDEMQISGAGYFMLKQSTLYFTEDSPFPSNYYVPGSDLLVTWDAAIKKYSSGFEQILSGFLVARGLEDSTCVCGADEGFVLEPPCQFCNFGNLCGKTYSE
ncbi:MAG: PD-(D/E)XK nuclease family protein [Candidatus Obscuribacterales bacterium]|nr:PD-(D/E)XK nuclease family protein [Candidatus Obscuribacterales bacterium]